mmetsp:Transcript_12711/g.29372  ORF Transcript_12711/g.29372 Transcript_12711/m.29372 type:complete len:100 (-) Transcript_12711:32-331(-)
MQFLVMDVELSSNFGWKNFNYCVMTNGLILLLLLQIVLHKQYPSNPIIYFSTKSTKIIDFSILYEFSNISSKFTADYLLMSYSKSSFWSYWVIPETRKA